MDSLLKLANPAFKLEWGGKEYEVKKATLGQVAEYQARMKQYIADSEPASDPKLAAFALYLILKSHIEGLTEQQVLDETPGDLNVLELLVQLGFLRLVKANPTPEAEAANPPTSASSS